MYSTFQKPWKAVIQVLNIIFSGPGRTVFRFFGSTSYNYKNRYEFIVDHLVMHDFSRFGYTGCVELNNHALHIR